MKATTQKSTVLTITMTEEEAKALDNAIRDVYNANRALVGTGGPLALFWNLLPYDEEPSI